MPISIEECSHAKFPACSRDLSADVQRGNRARDAQRGQRLFQNCATCHSLEPDKNLTGPKSVERGRTQSGTLPSFGRYSDAIKSSGVVWDENTLNAWLADPQHVIPGNDMTFPGNL